VPALLDVQRAMRAQLLGDKAVDERLGIYRNTVLSTLVNALRLSYPAVQRIVGADFFEAAAREFIRGHAPGSAYLNDFGGDFPRFLAQFAHAASLPYLADVAQLEWAINRALHAPDAPALDLARLASLGEDARAGVRFTAHPGLSLLRLLSPADAIWRAVLDQDDAAMAAIDPREAPVYLLIERDATGIQVRRLTAAGWRFTATLSAGKPLFEAFDEAVTQDQSEINALLAEHLASGRFIGEPRA
jgi:hypothetical protein